MNNYGTMNRSTTNKNIILSKVLKSYTSTNDYITQKAGNTLDRSIRPTYNLGGYASLAEL